MKINLLLSLLIIRLVNAQLDAVQINQNELEIRYYHQNISELYLDFNINHRANFSNKMKFNGDYFYSQLYFNISTNNSIRYNIQEGDIINYYVYSNTQLEGDNYGVYIWRTLKDDKETYKTTKKDFYFIIGIISSIILIYLMSYKQ